MRESIPMGMNRTGVQMSPFDSNAMLSIADATQPPPGDDTAIAAMRGTYIEDAEPLGSVPIPATVTGAVTTGIQMLTGNNPKIFIDKLGERLAFERTGTRLYDALITKFQVMHDGISSMQMSDLQKIRTDEARHFTLLAAALDSLGADPTAQTPSADLVGVESLGLVQVLSDPRTTLAQSLHAILTAELADQSGWELLITLADEHQQTTMKTDFTAALSEEREHLLKVQQWYNEAVMGTTYPDMTTGGNGAQTQTP
jgi:bacterioferritin (cytochrome b1)